MSYELGFVLPEGGGGGGGVDLLPNLQKGWECA